MAHIFTPNRPGNPNANDNISGIPEFIPIPAESATVNPSDSTPPAGATSSIESTAPATNAAVENAQPEDTATAPAAEKTAPKRGRPPKSAKPAKAQKKRSIEKEVTTIHFEPDTIQQLRIMHVLNKVSISEIVSACCEDMLNRTYQCHNPACNCKFTISDSDGTAPKPTCCPVCGSDKLRQQKPGF